jgi:hypothetical protein
MLDELEEDVDTTHSRLRATHKKVGTAELLVSSVLRTALSSLQAAEHRP